MKYKDVDPLEKLHSNEPYFFFRAQDKFMTYPLMHYATILRHNGLIDEGNEVSAFVDKVRDWQESNPDKVKIPD